MTSVGSVKPMKLVNGPDFRAAGARIQPHLVALRRQLHQIPELMLDLPLTQAAVLAALADLPLEISTGKQLSSITAVLRGGKPGPAVLLRGDMDALPVVEQTGYDFAATTGNMHACGHDLHMAGLVGAARLLSEVRDELAGSVVFMFQPGEEGAGGAKIMVEEGVLDAAGERVVAAYGIHVMPAEHGAFYTRGGPLMAGSNQLHVRVVGVGGHGSSPDRAVDPIPALLEIGTAIQVMVTREFSVFDPIVCTITQLRGGEAINVIGEDAFLGATVRTLSETATERFGRRVRELAESIAAAHRCRAEVEWQVCYPVTVNDEAEAQFVLDTLGATFGAERVNELPAPWMGSEDFSFVLNEVPGTYLFLGTVEPGQDPESVPNNHSPFARFDDSVLGDQAAALATLAWSRLNS